MKKIKLLIVCSAAIVFSGCFDPGNKKVGSVIFLNGPSSTGKSTLTKKLQNILPEPYLHIGIDKVIGMMPEKMNDFQGHSEDKQGFFWKITQGENEEQLAFIQMGEYGLQMQFLLKDLVITMLKNGFNVIVDEICILENSFKEWQKILAPYHPLYVGLTASLETLEKREKERGDRMIGSAKAQYNLVHRDASYDLVFDVDKVTIDDCVKSIVNYRNKEKEVTRI